MIVPFREHIPADLVHHFLLAICTRPGGWDPRESEHWWPEHKQRLEQVDLPKIYNEILANILKTLKVNEDSRQQELALKIMLACPELVAG